MRYEIITTNAFKKGLKAAKKRGKDLQKLTDIVETLAEGKQLSANTKTTCSLETTPILASAISNQTGS